MLHFIFKNYYTVDPRTCSIDFHFILEFQGFKFFNISIHENYRIRRLRFCEQEPFFSFISCLIYLKVFKTLNFQVCMIQKIQIFSLTFFKDKFFG
jgi:hypothetical protein